MSKLDIIFYDHDADAGKHTAQFVSNCEECKRAVKDLFLKMVDKETSWIKLRERIERL